MGFNNPLTGLNGSLIYPQIKSPNFSLSGKTGWAILKNGDAYFFDVVAQGTVTASEFIGTDFMITSNGVFFYTGTPGNGNLSMSWAEAGGTDQFGNAYQQGLSINEFSEGEASLNLGYTSGSPLIYWTNDIPNVKNSASILGTPVGSGTAQQDGVTFLGASDTTYNDFTALQQYASSRDGTNPAKIQWVYTSRAGVEQILMTGGAGGVVVGAGNLTAVQPGTGSEANPAVGETWHTAALTANFTSNVADTPPRYRFEGMGAGVVRLDGTAYTTASPVAAGSTIFTLPNGYKPIVLRRRYVQVTNASGYTVGGTVVQINPTGTVVTGPVAATAGEQFCMDGITFPVD